MKKIFLLGATGSIGTSTLEVIRKYPKDFELVGVSANSNMKKLEMIIKEFKPKYAVLTREHSFKDCDYCKFLVGEKSYEEILFSEDVDIILIAISGIAGLYPTIKAIESGKRVVSANKESLVAAGDIVLKHLEKYNQTIFPVDSEHNAIFNIFSRIEKNFIKKIILTASGGPFLKKEITERTSIEEVLAHPTWNMGNYITVNSATMMNKGFEVIEAHYLFKMEYERIDVLIHPQSLVHGIVETIDGTHFMGASPNDMKFPIALALFYPAIPEQKFKSINLYEKPLEFFKVDQRKFPLLEFCYEMGRIGGLAPTVLNATNEYFVDSFLKGKIKFSNLPSKIIKTTEKFINTTKPERGYSLEDVFTIDSEVRKFCEKL
ncbi:MAG: 1-deoxy-D-xylulose-5-phosphate reductoisomerase [Brevinematales bacterium]|nr:1-deoxy-D-xylulose-5-phosphate reductoisomerase [Brevinematales bacterium]